MSEFKDVMEQWKRYCDAMSMSNGICKCDVCKLREVLCSKTPRNHMETICEAEKIIMDWAKEHPEPQYPTWWEWLVDMGVVPSLVKPDIAYELTTKTGLGCTIPADIAEKLGIEPKKVSDNA